MKIETLNPDNLNLLRAEINAALAPICEKFDINFTLGKITYNPKNANAKLEIATKGEGGVVISKEATNFTNYATLYGLQPEDLGRTFTDWNKKSYTITGLNMKSEKAPVVATSLENGKSYRWPASAVKTFLAMSKAS